MWITEESDTGRFDRSRHAHNCPVVRVSQVTNPVVEPGTVEFAARAGSSPLTGIIIICIVFNITVVGVTLDGDGRLGGGSLRRKNKTGKVDSSARPSTSDFNANNIAKRF